MTKEAADIHVPGMTNLNVAHAAANSGLFSGVGYYEGSKKNGPHAHVDIKKRSKPLATWTQDKEGNTTPGLPSAPENED